jgi:hypothetical protein
VPWAEFWSAAELCCAVSANPSPRCEILIIDS